MKIYVLAGKAKSGKDLLGKYMKTELDFKGKNACILRLTSPLYEYAKNYFSWDGDEKTKPREFLQEMGIEIIKNQLGKKHFLIDRLCEDIEILKTFFDIFIITDARLIEEFEELKKRYPNTKVIYIKRENYDNLLSEKEKNHITEKELEKYDNYDYIVENTSKEELLKQSHFIINDMDGEVI